jgi:hypothetical protein
MSLGGLEISFLLIRSSFSSFQKLQYTFNLGGKNVHQRAQLSSKVCYSPVVLFVFGKSSLCYAV